MTIVEEKKKRHLGVIIHFLESINIPVAPKSLADDTFLPGIEIADGVIYYDVDKLNYPGDILHEAGHLALMKPEQRAVASGDLEPADMSSKDRLEIGVILWTYAALQHLQLDLKVVFHEDGYKGDSDWLIETFKSGNYIGLPLLQWMGLCKHQNETDDSTPEFPHMLKWLRE